MGSPKAIYIGVLIRGGNVDRDSCSGKTVSGQRERPQEKQKLGFRLLASRNIRK